MGFSSSKTKRDTLEPGWGRRSDGRAPEGERSGGAEGKERVLERLGTGADKKKVGENGGEDDE